MRTVAKSDQEFGQYVVQLTVDLMGVGEPQSLSELESHIRQLLLKLSQFYQGPS